MLRWAGLRCAVPALLGAVELLWLTLILPAVLCCAALRCACHARHRLLSSPPRLTRLSQRKLRTPCTLPCDAPASSKQLKRISNHTTILQVMSVVKSLAAHGITICATIHSPTPYTFNLFDRLLLLLKGRVVYFGPNGERLVASVGSAFRAGHRQPLGAAHLR